MSESTRQKSSSTNTKRVNNISFSDRLLELIKSLQFVWFLGHVFTLSGSLFYLSSYVSTTSFHKFWYTTAFFGVVLSFGVLVVQLVQKVGFDAKLLIKDDNFEYFILGLGFFFLRPYTLIPLLPFGLFSFFHVLAYTRGFILPIFELENTSASKMIENFTRNNNVSSITLASFLELYSLIWLTLRVVLFRRNSLLPCILYGAFLKLRFEKSALTRNCVKDFVVQIDQAINKTQNPKAKELWFKFKMPFKKLGKYNIIAQTSKEAHSD